jgi:hypothetical protein
MKPIAKKRGSGITAKSHRTAIHRVADGEGEEVENEAKAIDREAVAGGGGSERAAIQARTSRGQQAGLEVETTTATKKTTLTELKVEQVIARAVPDIILVVDTTIRVEATARRLIDDRPITIDSTVATLKTRSLTVDITTTTTRVRRPIQDTIRLIM